MVSSADQSQPIFTSEQMPVGTAQPGPDQLGSAHPDQPNKQNSQPLSQQEPQPMTQEEYQAYLQMQRQSEYAGAFQNYESDPQPGNQFQGYDVPDQQGWVQGPLQPQPEFLIAEWLGDSRVTTVRSRQYYSSLAVIVLLSSLFLFFAV